MRVGVEPRQKKPHFEIAAGGLGRFFFFFPRVSLQSRVLHRDLPGAAPDGGLPFFFFSDLSIKSRKIHRKPHSRLAMRGPCGFPFHSFPSFPPLASLPFPSLPFPSLLYSGKSKGQAANTKTKTDITRRLCGLGGFSFPVPALWPRLLLLPGPRPPLSKKKHHVLYVGLITRSAGRSGL